MDNDRRWIKDLAAAAHQDPTAQAALDEFLRTFPPELRDEWRGLITQADGHRAWLAYPDDPDKQRLVTEYYRAVNTAFTRLLDERRSLEPAAAVMIRVAVVDDDRAPGSDQVLRRIDHPVHDVLVLRRSMLSAESVHRAVAFLQSVWRTHGLIPASPTAIDITTESIADHPDPDGFPIDAARTLVARLQLGKDRVFIEGLGPLTGSHCFLPRPMP